MSRENPWKIENDSLRAELERVKIERDSLYESCRDAEEVGDELRRNLDKAVRTLREIRDSGVDLGSDLYGSVAAQKATRTISEIEGR